MQAEPELRQVKPLKVIGRYALYTEVATGGMATVYLGRLLGPVGFSRTVAIKRLHQQYAKDPEFTAGFLDEARLAARIRHPNVIPTLDVVALEGELFLVMEYIQGESLAFLIRAMAARQQKIPPPIATALMSGVLQGLHAAHEARSERGEALGIVHRDVSPQNVLVGTDGVPRVLDFGVAKAVGRLQSTREGQLKGKLAYMAPEQVAGAAMTRQSDIFSASVVLWETLAGRRLFRGDSEADTLYNVLQGPIEPPSAYASGIPAALESVLLRGLERDANKRWRTALEMAIELEKTIGFVSPRSLGEWVEDVARDKLALRQAQLAEIECVSSAGIRPTSNPPPTMPAPSALSDDSVGASALSLSTQARRRRSAIAAIAGVAALALLLVVWKVVAAGSTPGPSTSPAASPPAVTAVETPAAAKVEPSAGKSPEDPASTLPTPAASDSAAASATSEKAASPRTSRERPSRSKRPASSSKKPTEPVYSRE